MRVLAVLLAAAPIALMVTGLFRQGCYDDDCPCRYQLYCPCHNQRICPDLPRLVTEGLAGGFAPTVHVSRETEQPDWTTAPTVPRGDHIPPAVIQGIVLKSENVQVEPGQLELEGPEGSAD